MRRVHIEFQRVQTWLFAVPRLRAMVGANALLGRTLRVDLPELARKTGQWKLKPDNEGYPSADPDDPLKEHDNPEADARDGILSRDGGHFEARFVSGAEAFADAAGQLLRRELPGLRFRIRIDNNEYQQSHVHLSTELPVLSPCEWTGRGLASAEIKQGGERPSVSLDVERRHESARLVENGNAVDLVSLLSKGTRLHELNRPQDLDDLAGSGYLALIHADGNGVGSGAGKGDSKRAASFHRNRVLLRRALQKAIIMHCPGSGQAPLIPLMLGGDDLLLVARAEIALPFVVTLCAELEALQKNSAGFKLTLGVGVVVAKHTIPIHRLHEVAGQLASSAKRRFRGFKNAAGEERSVVDWAVYTTAWVDDPEEIRRRDWIRGKGQDLRVLSQRPVDVLVDVLGDRLSSLQGLVEGAKKLQAAPRSQLRYLVDQLARGRSLTELAFAELAKEARAALEEAGVKAPWRRASNGGPWLTELLDLVEISEIARLGRSAEDPHPAKEAALG
ncbi:MAG: hypothetical protein GMKNLPBB_01992 [Myxococcota bacterium]|nr:hypothetical protein [Myxococcota bacterium]